MNEAKATWVDGWALEVWHGRPFDPFGDRGEPEERRASDAAELRKLVLAARADPQVARYEASRKKWLDMHCTHGHPLEWVEAIGYRYCQCRRSHHVYHCKHCATDYYQPAYGPGCDKVIAYQPKPWKNDQPSDPHERAFRF